VVKPFDISKFRRSLTKSIENISVGFNDPKDWISTGSYLLNYLISGDFNKGVPLGKVTVFAGQPSSGKSYLCSANIVKHAQEKGIFVVLIDTENALDKSWLEALGVDTSEDKILRLSLNMIDDVGKVISSFMKDYKQLEDENRPKILFVIDSLGMLLTNTDVDQFERGDMKGDMGRKAKALTALVRNVVNLFGNYNVGLVATNHTYMSQDLFSKEDKISGGLGFIFASSIVVAIKSLKLKEDEQGNKLTEVTGIRAACKVVKTRYNKPFESMKIRIPYDSGLDPYSGLFDFFLEQGVLTKEGNRYKYINSIGKEIKLFRKYYNKENYEELMTLFSLNKFNKNNNEVKENDSIGGTSNN